MHLQKVCCYVTRRCNISCSYCGVKDNTAIDMPLEKWLTVFDVFKQARMGFVVLFGGEPTLRDDLPDMVNALNERGLAHTIITNGIRMIVDQEYYNKVLATSPYGISCSVNFIDEFPKDSDGRKSWYGKQLLDRLYQMGYTGDLVANIAVTDRNVDQLYKVVRYYTDRNIWVILTGVHLDDGDWIYRKKGKDLIRRADILAFRDWILQNYTQLKLHNSRDYFIAWDKYMFTRDWKCSYLTCPTVDTDGKLLVCIDRRFSENITVWDLVDIERVTQVFNKDVSNCPGCFYDHMYETNLYAGKNEVELGKRRFQHADSSGISSK